MPILSKEEVNSIAEDIMESFQLGELISHEWLKQRLDIQRPVLSDFDNEYDLWAAIDKYGFDYMGAIDDIRALLLTTYKYYFKNIRGDGYVLLHPNEQTDFAKNKFKEDLRRVINNTHNIMTNVNHRAMDAIKLRENADAVAKFSQIKNMLKSVKI